MIDAESVGLGSLKKLFNVVRGLKNFKNLSLMGKLRTIGVPIALFGIPLGVHMADSSKIGALALTPAQLEMAGMCEDNHDAADLTFTGASNKLGCACTAKIVSAGIPARHLTHFEPIHAYALASCDIESVGETEAQSKAHFEKVTQEKMSAIGARVNENADTLYTLFDSILTADNLCDNSSFYTEASLSELGQLTAWSEPVWSDRSGQVVEISLRGADDVLRVSTE